MSQLPRTQLAGSLGVPGLAITPPVSRGAQEAMQLAQTLNIFGNVAGNIGQLARHETEIRKQKQNEINNALEGQAVNDFNKQWPDLQKEINDGKFDFLFDNLKEGEEVGPAVEAYLRGKVSGEGIPAVYTEKSVNYSLEKMTTAVINRQQKLITDSMQTAVDQQLSGLASGATRTEVAENIVSVTNGRINLSDASKMTFRQSLNYAMEQPDPVVAVAALKDGIPAGMEPDYWKAANDAYDRHERDVTAAQAKDRENATQWISGIENSMGNAVALDAMRKRQTGGKPIPAHMQAWYENNIVRLKRETRNDSIEAIDGIVGSAMSSGEDPSVMRENIVNQAANLPELNVDEIHDVVDKALLARMSAVSTNLTTGYDTKIQELKRVASVLSHNDLTQTKSNTILAGVMEKRDQAAASHVNVLMRQQAVTDAVNRFAEGNGYTALGAGVTDVTYQDTDGETHTITAKSIEDAAYDQLAAGSLFEATAGVLGLDPERLTEMTPQAMADAVRAARENALKADPQLQNKLDAAQTGTRIMVSMETGHVDPVLSARLKNSRVSVLPGGLPPEQIPPGVVADFNLYNALEKVNMGKRTAGDDVSRMFDRARLAIDTGVAVGPANDQDALARDAISKATRPDYNVGSVDTSDGSEFDIALREAAEAIGVDIEKDDRLARDMAFMVKQSVSMGVPTASAIQKARAMMIDRSVSVNGYMTNIRDVPIDKNTFASIGSHLMDYALKEHPDEVKAAGGVDGLIMDYDPRTEVLEIYSADLFSSPLVSITKQQLLGISAQYGGLESDTRLVEQDTLASVRHDRLKAGNLIPEDYGVAFWTIVSGRLSMKTDEQIMQEVKGRIAAGNINPIVRPLPIPKKTGDPEVDKINSFIAQKLSRRLYDKTQDELESTLMGI